jgi:hypothetical protein
VRYYNALASSSPSALQRFIGMVRSPRATLTDAVRHRRSLDLAVLIIVISVICSSGFLMTRVGRLAALDQQVRQLESFGAVVTDDTYETLRALVPYRPIVSAAAIVVGWPILWIGGARVLVAVGDRVLGRPRGPDENTARRREQALTIVVHASAILAVRAMVAAPINYARESLGGATSLSMIMPAFGQSTFPARLFGAVDVFVVWWVVLVALGVSILYQTRTLPIARWLFGAYAVGAAALALTQALRGGV